MAPCRSCEQGGHNMVQCSRGQYLSRSAEAMATQASLSAGLICHHKAATGCWQQPHLHHPYTHWRVKAAIILYNHIILYNNVLNTLSIPGRPSVVQGLYACNRQAQADKRQRGQHQVLTSELCQVCRKGPYCRHAVCMQVLPERSPNCCYMSQHCRMFDAVTPALLLLPTVQSAVASLRAHSARLFPRVCFNTLLGASVVNHTTPNTRVS